MMMTIVIVKVKVIVKVIVKIIMRKNHIILEIKVIITIIDIKNMVIMVIIKTNIININVMIFMNIDI